MLRRRRANGLLRSSNGYESLGGARAAISLSTIAGARDTLSGSAKSQPNSSSARSLSFSHTTPHRRSQQSRRHRQFPSCSQRLVIQSAPESSQVWRDRVAISPDCQARHPTLLVKGSNSSSSSSPVCIDWLLWPTSIIPTLPSISASSTKPPVRSGLRCLVLRSDEAKSSILFLTR